IFLLALDLDNRSGNHRLAGRSWRNGSCRGFASRSSSLALGLFFSLTLGFFLGLQTLGLGSCLLSFQLALLLGFELFRAALDEGFLLAHCYADGLAASDLEGAGGLALQGNLARLLGLVSVTALEMGQQGLFLTIGHHLFGTAV